MAEMAPALGVARGSDLSGSPAALTRRDFFADIIEHLRPSLPSDLQQFQYKANANLLKIYYANERIHYEVWTNSHTRTIEVGLHFEDGPLSTSTYLAHFNAHIVELKHLLGPQMELERWTTSWGHLYELLPLTPLNSRLATTLADRLAAMIGVLQPLVELAGVGAERSAQPQEQEARGPWRKWRRGGR